MLLHVRTRAAASVAVLAGTRSDRPRAAGRSACGAARRGPSPARRGRARHTAAHRTRPIHRAVDALPPVGDQVLAELLRTLRDDRAVFDLALNGFVGACKRTGQDEPYGRPLVLDWYTRATAERPEAARAIAEMWRAALGDRVHTGPALDVLRRWVLAADRDPAAEWALAALLPALVTSAPEHPRIDHLLRTMPGEDGAPPPPAAGRLLTVLPPLGAAGVLLPGHRRARAAARATTRLLRLRPYLQARP
ncbi:hypothetical protein [Streptomyces scopuliridis]|uniref:hypothetical protein n=1 Tax=Streptomyces scopuliridis TaxID=452529 RepID=UPI0036BE2FCB